MVEDILCTGPVSSIAELVKQCDFPPEAFLLIERLPQRAVFDDERQNLLYFARLGDNIDITPYTSGRIFDQNFELRWEQDTVTGMASVVYLGSPRAIVGLTRDKVELPRLKPATRNPRYYYLFGQLLNEQNLEQMSIVIAPDTEYYAEVRIPRLLCYPRLKKAQRAASAQRVQLAVYEYIDQETGRVKLFRFQDLKAAE